MNSLFCSGDKLNTLVGLVINTMQHGMICVGLGMMPSSNKAKEMNQIAGPGPKAPIVSEMVSRRWRHEVLPRRFLG